MSEEKVNFLSLEEAAQLVGAIQEEEDIEQNNRRILTVYNRDDRELCWFDYDEVMLAVEGVHKADKKEAVQNYILKHIPDWALELYSPL